LASLKSFTHDAAEGRMAHMKVNQFLSFCLFAICAMLGVATNRVLAEDAPGILVIVKASYGDLPSGDQSDVTEKVKAMVKNNSLTVDATNENFDDPAEGIVKKLSVEYTIDGVKQSKTVDESETLTISGKESTGKGKLVIHKAFYGDLPDGGKTDVTAQVAAAVKNDRLSLEATNDIFGDPAECIVKKLTVVYTFEGEEKSKTVEENETLTISDKGE